jgi:RNA polymerase sigma factor (TIGR02999 family)
LERVADGCAKTRKAAANSDIACRTAFARQVRVDVRHEVTGLLLAWRSGESGAADRLFAVVYDELRGVARRQLRRERASHTLDTTALVHEAYFRLVDQTRADWVDRAQFLAIASRVMRRILVDHARRRRAAKRGGARVAVTLGAAEAAGAATATLADERASTLLAVDAALTRLAEHETRLARVVECRFFGGLTDAETSEVLGVTERTVQRDWAKAKGWLYQELRA